jgi:hypothetical protein
MIARNNNNNNNNSNNNENNKNNNNNDNYSFCGQERLKQKTELKIQLNQQAMAPPSASHRLMVYRGGDLHEAQVLQHIVLLLQHDEAVDRRRRAHAKVVRHQRVELISEKREVMK